MVHSIYGKRVQPFTKVRCHHGALTRGICHNIEQMLCKCVYLLFFCKLLFSLFIYNIIYINVYIYFKVCLYWIFVAVCRLLWLQNIGLVALWLFIPWPGIEAVSSAFKGSFLTTGPPGTSPRVCLYLCVMNRKCSGSMFTQLITAVTSVEVCVIAGTPSLLVWCT